MNKATAENIYCQIYETLDNASWEIERHPLNGFEGSLAELAKLIEFEVAGEDSEAQCFVGLMGHQSQVWIELDINANGENINLYDRTNF